MAADPRTVLELSVNNHPGVMSHICGLFARRAFNLEGIACLPEDDGAKSRIWLLVHSEDKLEQMMRQLEKLEDVNQVTSHQGNHLVFQRLREFFMN